MSLFNFLKNFYKRKGSYIFSALIAEKITGFFVILIATNLLSKEDFGGITYANSTLTFIIPFVGFGIHQGLLRYGALSSSQQEKKYLFNIALKKGVYYSAILVLIVILATPLITYNLRSSLIYLLILSFQIISLYLLELIKIYALLINRKILYFKIICVNSIFLIILTLINSFLYSGIGYVVSLVLVPFIVSIWFIFTLKLTIYNKLIKPLFKLKEFIFYGLYTSLSGVLSQLLYAIDVLLIGNLIFNPNLIAQYKIANILPFSFLFLPLVFMKTDFVLLANKSEKDKLFIKKYYINYLKLFTPFTIIFIAFFYVFSSDLYVLFGSQYTNEDNLMFIFSVGVVGALLLRIPLGNMLSAVGKVRTNTVISLVTFVVNIVLSYFFIIKYGIKGAAIATSFLLWFSGLLSLIAFIRYLNNKPTEIN